MVKNHMRRAYINPNYPIPLLPTILLIKGTGTREKQENELSKLQILFKFLKISYQTLLGYLRLSSISNPPNKNLLVV